MDWKLDLYTKIASAVAPHAIVASNTSGLSITKLSEVLPAEIRPRFCGIHFFNPPRYMALVELIPTPSTLPDVLDALEAFVTTSLGKSVVRAKDTPNFIANRVGIAGMLATIKEAETYGLTYDVVDDLTGKRLGRASSGTFRTADVVGLDTMAHVIKTLQDNLADDPFFASYATPKALEQLLAAGSLGQKSGAGFYKKVGKDILRFDPESGDYGPAAQGRRIVAAVKKPTPRASCARSKHRKRSSCGRSGASFHYARSIWRRSRQRARLDFAMRWGFGREQGPFDSAAGGLVAGRAWIQEDIDAGRRSSTVRAARVGFRRARRRRRRRA